MAARELSSAFHVEVTAPHQERRGVRREPVAIFLARQILECDHRVEQSAGRRFVGVGFGGDLRGGRFAAMDYRVQVELQRGAHRQHAPAAPQKILRDRHRGGEFFRIGHRRHLDFSDLQQNRGGAIELPSRFYAIGVLSKQAPARSASNNPSR
jgi:hypothetical protein